MEVLDSPQWSAYFQVLDLLDSEGKRYSMITITHGLKMLVSCSLITPQVSDSHMQAHIKTPITVTSLHQLTTLHLSNFFTQTGLSYLLILYTPEETAMAESIPHTLHGSCTNIT